MNFPSNLKYTKEHEWVRLEGDTVVVGVTDFAQGELGDIVFVEIETIGSELGMGEVFGNTRRRRTKPKDAANYQTGRRQQLQNRNLPRLLVRSAFGQRGLAIKLISKNFALYPIQIKWLALPRVGFAATNYAPTKAA